MVQGCEAFEFLHGFAVWDLGFKAYGFRILLSKMGAGLQAEGVLRVSDSGFRVYGSGLTA